MKTIPILNLVKDDLEWVEQKMRQATQTEYPPLTTVLQHLLDSGGKRVRPALVLLASKFYPADMERVIAVAAAVELLHTATLVHDDMIDQAIIRRGNPTLNSIWSEGATVLAGDYLFARSAALAAEARNVQVMSIFAATLMTICDGELRQLFRRRGEQWSRDDYYRRIYAKTAALFAAATEAAAVLGEAPPEATQALRDYGRYLGMAFQVVDDVLDFVGDPQVLGKPTGSDLRQGIVTLPTMIFLEQNPADERVWRVLRGEDTSEEVVQMAVDVICGSEAIAAAMQEARDFAARSCQAISRLPDNPYRQAMLDLADFVVERIH